MVLIIYLVFLVAIVVEDLSDQTAPHQLGMPMFDLGKKREYFMYRYSKFPKIKNKLFSN